MNAIGIRSIRSCDVEPVYRAVLESKAELSEWMVWCHDGYSRQDTIEWVESRDEAWQRNEEWSFVITDAFGAVIGACGIHRLDLRQGVGEIGYWVRTSKTGRGVASEAVRQLAEWAFAERAMHRLEIVASVENVASRRVGEKAGAVREAVLRERLLVGGCRHDAVLLVLLATGRH